MGKAKFAYTAWQWGTANRQQFIQALKDIREAGYDYFESVKAAIDIFRDDVAGFKALCDEYAERPIGFYFHFTGDWDNDVEDARRKMPFMAECGIHRMNVQATGSTAARATRAELDYDLKALNVIAKTAKEYDILPCLHPHHNTTVMFEDEIDFILENTDPALVAFGPDTAHLVAGNCDPAKVIGKYADRVKFIHLKDICGSNVESVGYQFGVEVYSNFRELGEGLVDFPAIFRILDDVGYDGFLTVELDESRFGNKESAMMSMAYLKENYRQE